MNGIQGIKPSGQQCNRIFDAVVTILKYNRSKIDHTIYTKFFYDGKVSYLAVSTDYFLNTANNEIAFPELTRFLMNISRLNSKKDLSLSI